MAVAPSLKSANFTGLPDFDACMAACAPFEQRPDIAVAVSGGADSMSLLMLAQRWARARGGRVIALTVNHHIRAEAADEVAQVGTWCKAAAIEQHVLDWWPSHHSRGLQEQAREGRYALLTEWCRQHHILHLLTGHTADDQCETLFFRLARGSQLDGLAGMAVVSERNGIRLLRPLLHCRKHALMGVLRQMGQAWIEDPSNQQDYYSRNALRHILAKGENDVTQEAVGIAAACSKIRNGLFYNNVSSLTELVSLYPQGYAMIDFSGYCALSEESRTRLLAALIPSLNGAFHPPRSTALLRLQHMIAQGHRSVLAGLVFTCLQNSVVIYREKAAMAGAYALPAGHWQGLWDQRFSIDFQGTEGFMLRPLDKDGLDFVAEFIKLPSPMRHKGALVALPSLWYLEELVAAPHISYHRAGFEHITFRAVFSPLKPLAGSPFFGFNTDS